MFDFPHYFLQIYTFWGVVSCDFKWLTLITISAFTYNVSMLFYCSIMGVLYGVRMYRELFHLST